MDLVIRPATVADAGGIVNILNPIIEAGMYTMFDTPFTVDAEQRYLRRHAKVRNMYIDAIIVERLLTE